MMQTQTTSRKRPAPGTSPPAPAALANPSIAHRGGQPDVAQMSNEDFLAWGAGGGAPTTTVDNSTMFDNENSNRTGSPRTKPLPAPASNQLVRRNNERSMAATGQPYSPSEDRQTLVGTGLQVNNAWRSEDDDGALRRRAAFAKQEALSKKPPKQIPPFIQKLSSFLDNNHNTDLIRWSDDGDSFIVIDEEQFANKLIPELFKHNNYASFVRQLNMYGFHKKVGLTDNSMRASERKAKSPSEYDNNYFKRGRPDLLWLIAKPKQTTSKAKNKKPRDDDEASEDSDRRDGDDNNNDEPTVAGSSKKLDLVTLPRTQLVSFQSEIEQLRKSQQHINSMIARFQHENNQYIRQASAQHERHEHSINAILQFLATFYSRSQDSGAMPNMFPMPIPDNQPQGNVREMGDYEEPGAAAPNNQLARQTNRRLALLPPPADGDRSATPDRAPPPTSQQQQQQPQLQGQANVQPSPNVSPRLQDRRSGQIAPNTAAANAPSPQVKDESASPVSRDPQSAQAPPNQQQSNTAQQPSNNDILAIINSSNASSNPQPDFDISTALRNFENNGTGPLTPSQRDNMLNMMASNSGASTPVFPSTTPPNTNNAMLYSPHPNPAATMNPSLDAYTNTTRDHLQHLQRLQQDQDNKVNSLTNRLQPLSPSGSIPGLTSSSPPNFNFDNWINSTADGDDDFFGSGATGFGTGFDDNGNRMNGSGNDNGHGNSSNTVDAWTLNDDGPSNGATASGLVDPNVGFGEAGGYFGDAELPPLRDQQHTEGEGLFDGVDDEDVDDDVDEGDDGDGDAVPPVDVGNDGDALGQRGRVIGSVSASVSEGGRSPAPVPAPASAFDTKMQRAVEADDGAEEPTGQRRSKRRRVGV